MDDWKQLEEDNNNLKDELKECKAELKTKSQERAELKVASTKSPLIFQELVSYRPPSSLYCVFLKEQWLIFHLHKRKICPLSI